MDLSWLSIIKKQEFEQISAERRKSIWPVALNHVFG